MYVLYIGLSSMKVYDIYSKRQKILMGKVPDVYQYENIPIPLRVQIVHIMSDALGEQENQETLDMYKLIHDILCREYGKLSLVPKISLDLINHIDDVKDFILQNEDINQVIDVVELSFRLIDRFYREVNVINSTEPEITPDEAIEELNIRFREHGVGYQYESGEIIRVDSQIIHADVVKPVLQLLSDKLSRV